MLHLRGLLLYIEQHLEPFWLLAQQHPVALDLMYQLHQVMDEDRLFLSRTLTRFHEAACRAEEANAELEAQRRVLQAQAEAHMVVGGEERLPPQHTTVGLTEDGRHFAVTQHTGQALILCGPQGKGKSQTGINVIEGATLSLPGLSRMQEFSNAVVFTTDLHKGKGNHQHFCGLHPNPYPEQWQYLRDKFNILFGPGNAAHRHIIVPCMPGIGAVARYQKMYPDLCERGLDFRETKFHPSEQNSLFYQLMVQGGEVHGKGRSQKRIFIEDWLGHHGEGADPRKLLEDLLKARLPGVNEAGLRSQFRLIERLTSQHERLISMLDEKALIVVLLESMFAGPDRLLPLQIAMINAWSRETAKDPHRWFLLHELGKLIMMSEEMGQYLIEVIGEIRHRPLSFILETHLIGQLPAALVPLVTGIFQYGGVSEEDYHKLQKLFWAFHRVPFRKVAELGPGKAYVAFRQATDPRFMQEAQVVEIRPSCVWAGGETLAVV